MDRAEVKEGILCLLQDSRGRTLEEIQGFLKDNSAAGYFGDDSETALLSLLDDMREEGLIEERFMADGADTVDFAIEEEGKEFLKKRGNAQSKWDTGKPKMDMSRLMREKMSSLEDME